MDCSPPGSSVHGDSPGKSTGMGCHALLQGTFPTQGLSLMSLALAVGFFTTSATWEVRLQSLLCSVLSLIRKWGGLLDTVFSQISVQNVYGDPRKTVSLILGRFWKARLSKVWQLFDCKISQKLSYVNILHLKEWNHGTEHFPNLFDHGFPFLDTYFYCYFWTTVLHRTKLGTWLSAWSRLHSVSRHGANY